MLNDEASVQDFVRVLEEYKKSCERQGKYVEADIAKKRLEELRQHEDGRRQEALRSRQVAQRLGIEEAHMLEFQQFNTMWDRKMKEYDERAAELLEAMRQRHELDASEFGQKKLAAESLKKTKHSRCGAQRLAPPAATRGRKGEVWQEGARFQGCRPPTPPGPNARPDTGRAPQRASGSATYRARTRKAGGVCRGSEGQGEMEWDRAGRDGAGCEGGMGWDGMRWVGMGSEGYGRSELVTASSGPVASSARPSALVRSPYETAPVLRGSVPAHPGSASAPLPHRSVLLPGCRIASMTHRAAPSVVR